MRLKKSIRWKRSARVDKFVRRMRLKEFMRLPAAVRAGIIAILVIGVTAAMLIAAHQPSPSREGKPGRAVARSSEAPLAPVADATMATAPALESAAKPAGAKSAPVTITGCLERDDRVFRLKDTAGADAPKSRSWKTAFLKKGAASVKVLDAANRVKLPDHVGRRVSVTGILVDREMQVRSLQRVAASCTNGKKVKI